MNFRALRIDNFMSHRKTLINFPEKPELVLILGNNLDSGHSSSNGSGKSTIFEALYWCLYGVTTRGSRSQELVARTANLDDGESLSRVEVDFDWKGTRYTFVRGRSKTGPFFRLYRGSDLLDKNSKTTKFPMSQELFRSAVYLPQTRLDSFSNSGDSMRKRILSEILSLQAYSGFQDITKKMLAQNKASMAEGEEQTLTLEGKITQLKKEIQGYEDNITDSTQEVHEDFGKVKRRIMEERQNLVRQRSPLEREITFLDNQLKPAERERLKVAYEAFVTGIKDLEREISIGETRLKKLGDVCPLCEQPIPSSLKAQITEELPYTRLKKRLDKKEKYDAKIAKAEAFHFGIIERKNNTEIELKRVQGRLLALKRELENAGKIVDSSLEIVKKTKLQLEKAKKSLKDSRRRKNQIQKTIDAFRETERYLEFWSQSFSSKGIPSFLMDQSLPFLNEEGRKYLDYLAPEFTLTFDTRRLTKAGSQREEFSVAIDDDDRRYYTLSGGEQKRVDLAILMAIAGYTRQHNPVNLLFLDEVFGSLDPVGCDSTLELLQGEKKNQARTTYVISHQNDLQNSEIWDKVYIVTKKNNISTLEIA